MDPIEDLLWHSHQTVLVFGNITQVALWPPDPGQGLPGIMVAPEPEAARQFLDRNPMSRC